MFDKGSIIQYFRQKKGLTQEELGHGICSKTHLSKIERGLTEVSEETITLLCDRMGFSMEEELEKLENIKKLVETLQKQLIFQDVEKVSDLLIKFNHLEFSYIVPLYTRYLLLKARYLLLINNIKEAGKILFSKEIKKLKLPQPEEDILNHVLGIYYIGMNEYSKSLVFLKKVTLESYYNPEINYHLALTYYFCKAFTSSYYHCQKAKDFFVQMNNYKRVLDTESIMLMLLEDEGHLAFDEIQVRYFNLLEIAENTKDINSQIYLLHNYAYQLYKHKMYEEASKYYLRAMEVNQNNKFNHLISHFGNVRSIFDGSLKDEKTILLLIEEGLKEAKLSNQLLFINLFTLYQFKANKDELNYYLFIEKNLLPYLYEIKEITFFDHYIKELTEYYIFNNKHAELFNVFKNYSINITMGE